MKPLDLAWVLIFSLRADAGTQGRCGTWQRPPSITTSLHPFATTQSCREQLQLISVSPFARLCHCSTLHPGLRACLFSANIFQLSLCWVLPLDAVAVPVFSQPEAVVPCADQGLERQSTKDKKKPKKQKNPTTKGQ